MPSLAAEERQLIVAQILRRAVQILAGVLPVAFLAYTLFFRRDLFPVAFAAVLVFSSLGILGIIIASIAYRKRHGKYVFTPRFPEALFTERWLSGQGHKRLLLQRAGATNCLWLAVTADRLLVGPMFPFNLMFLSERSGFEYDLPASDIIAVTLRSPRFGRSIVTVRFRLGTDASGELDLAVRDLDGFMSAMAVITDSRSPIIH